MEHIVVRNKDNSISMIIPTKEALKKYNIEDIAKKDCPKDRPFWIIESDAIPSNSKAVE